jgi:phosphoribosylanthranilate isomerase
MSGRVARIAVIMWIKICGNTNLEDALVAVESGVDALGFVFADSPRRVTMEQVSEITARLPDRVETYGVFIDPDFDTVVNAVLECGLTGVQLHSLTDVTLPGRLRSYFDGGVGGGRLRILRAMHYSAGIGAELQKLRGEGDGIFDGVLVDSRIVGGSGVAFDWGAAREDFARGAEHLNLIVAGGLTPENVAEAIATLGPWGVDVVTGVEAAPGRKNHARVREFIRNVRRSGEHSAAKGPDESQSRRTNRPTLP